ncbi:hypothetical protein [uncultured Aquabacterium sp.]|jgi:hypothetical protein|uniref:hypothetical protein n=2 Tax=Pseudomonadota TaxID=1224 RepID=UPI00260E1CD9|nr:hypothetical protein [uncultured Aquabacterium sp.]
MVPTLYGLLMFLVGLFVSGQGILYMAVIATLFGGTAVAFATALGGANVTPAMLAQGFTGLNLMRREGLRGFLRPVEFATPTFWLLLLTVWAMATAFVMPRLLQGQLMVAGFDRSESGGAYLVGPLGPVSMNITQAMYAFLALMTFVMTRTLLTRPGAGLAAARAVLWAAGLNVVAALLEMAQYQLGLVPILAYLKNANYAMMGGEVAGLMRITGTFPETSMFSQYTLALVAFTHTLWMHGVLRGWARTLTLANLLLLLLSTSGTAYVSLAICTTVALLYTFLRLMRVGQIGPYSLYLKLTGSGLVLAVGVLLFVPPALDAVSDFFSVVIGQKLTSDSGAIRGALNAQALQTFVESFGLGAGLGCCRASSFALVVLSNLGWVGAVLFVFFVTPILFGRIPEHLASTDRVIAIGARRAVFATLVSASLIALVYDLGFLFYIMAALAYVPKRQP